MVWTGATRRARRARNRGAASSQSATPYRTNIQIANRRVTRDIHPMITQIEIRKLPLSEKLDLLESVWSELSSDPDAVDVPQWHKDILDERQRGLELWSKVP